MTIVCVLSAAVYEAVIINTHDIKYYCSFPPELQWMLWQREKHTVPQYKRGCTN